MTPLTRIAFEILAPAPLGLLGLMLSAVMEGAFRRDLRLGMDWSIAGFYLLAAYVIAGIPSLLYAFLLEWAFRAGVGPDSWTSVALSALLGALAGVGMMLVLNGSTAPGKAFIQVGGVGLITGLAMGIAIKRWSTGNEMPRRAITQ